MTKLIFNQHTDQAEKAKIKQFDQRMQQILTDINATFDFLPWLLKIAEFDPLNWSLLALNH
ncbi:hypothetical protein [Candidatus Phytoplasma prunorum]|uniref:hypothetical protein n=1 Tax=Candidatus Phytoplasma prunorum TaxID=47565 RepID=UPI002FEFDB4F